MFLFPQLTPRTAQALVAARAALPLADLQALSDPASVTTIYTPTGGNRISMTQLVSFQAGMRTLARDYGYPESLDTGARRRFDAPAARLLYEKMQISASEASLPGVWSFLACILLPDVVRWRFPGGPQGTAPERFLGNNRGLRNTFGRLWWRSHILHDPSAQDPFELIFRLGEDELVQVMERPNLAGSMLLAKQVVRSFLLAAETHPQISRSEILRDAMKRLRRLLPVIAFDLIEPADLEKLTSATFEETVHALQSGHG